MANLDIVSADDHIIEPPGLWQDRLPSRYREAGPRLQLADGDQPEAWLYEDRRVPTGGLNVAASFTKDSYTTDAVSYDQMLPACYDPLERVKAMDQDGVLGSLCFPTFPRLCGQTFAEGRDMELGLECVRVWNDWNLEEWAGAAPGRLIPMSIVPLWDPVAAAAEVRRVAALGSRAISFSENPAALGFPSIHDAGRHWDPLMEAIVETGLPMCLHIGSSSKLIFPMGTVPDLLYVAQAPLNSVITAFNWCLSELVQRFPGLKVVLSEGGIGWIPYALERMDFTMDHQGEWTGSTARFKRKPSEVFKEQFYGCFIDDEWGARHVLPEIGADRCLLEVDFPHSDGTWPNTQAVAAAHLTEVSDEDLHLLTRGNAERIFNFKPSAVGAL